MGTKIIIGAILGWVAYSISNDWVYSLACWWGYVVVSSALDHMYVGAK